MIKQLFPLLVAASASSWIDFRIRMLLTVMERLSEETLDRFEELEIMALRDGVEKGLLSESGITGSSVGG
jgi:hypothetical protein